MPNGNGTLIPRVNFGADPEFEWIDANGCVIPARTVNGHCPRDARNYRDSQIGTDGASDTGEMRPDPGIALTVEKSLNTLLTKAGKIAKRRDLRIVAGAGIAHPLGGHIHFSHAVPKDRHLIDRLDKFIAIPLREVSNAYNTRPVNGHYGRLGETKPQPHGWEYRAPVSWIAHPMVAKGVMRIAETLAKAVENGDIRNINTTKELGAYARKHARSPKATQWYIGNFYRIIERMKAKGVYLEHVEVLQAWGKLPVVETEPVEPEAPIVRPIAYRWNLDDFRMEHVANAYNGVADVNGANVNEGAHTAYTLNIGCYGAHRNRTESLENKNVIFVPRNVYNVLNTAEFAGMLNEDPENGGIWFCPWEQGNIGLGRELREEADGANWIANALVKLAPVLRVAHPVPPRNTNNRRPHADRGLATRAIAVIEGREI